ncbi:MAG: C45 family peptidase [Candidatus Omnitrophica bacterium]|nr:C45 family peptidase [Candidatus Omnitrophota bacterium]MCM8776779.1 C45 family peptidase [Candidatus Omnitrophota bacterium]
MLRVFLSGNSKDIGVKRAEELRSTILLVLEHFLYHHTFGPEKCIKWAKRWKKQTEEMFPSLLEEIKFLSKALNIDEEIIFAFNFRAWNALYSHPSHLACYNIGFFDATEGPLLGGVLEDGPPFYILEEIEPSSGYKHYSVALAGTVWAVRGLNSEGLAVGQVSAFPGMEVRKTDFHFGTEDYARSYFIMRYILQYCKDIKEAIDVFKRYPALGNFMMADNRDIAVVEKAGNLTGIRFCKDKYIIAGGHYLDSNLVTYLSGKGIIHIPDAMSVRRQQAVSFSVEKERPSLKLMKKILLSHSEEEGRFCNDIIQATTIAIPVKKQFYVAGPFPCHNMFKVLRLD